MYLYTSTYYRYCTYNYNLPACLHTLVKKKKKKKKKKKILLPLFMKNKI
jgi:hypothetical protein